LEFKEFIGSLKEQEDINKKDIRLAYEDIKKKF
jgi:hypothetical protein